jgi:hypothetical protein
MMLGGVICGYCATGRFGIATRPASVMTIDITEAKIGRSMKKRENTAVPQTVAGWEAKQEEAKEKPSRAYFGP